jgi:hypothetical protein
MIDLPAGSLAFPSITLMSTIWVRASGKNYWADHGVYQLSGTSSLHSRTTLPVSRNLTFLCAAHGRQQQQQHEMADCWREEGKKKDHYPALLFSERNCPVFLRLTSQNPLSLFITGCIKCFIRFR